MCMCEAEWTACKVCLAAILKNSLEYKYYLEGTNPVLITAGTNTSSEKYRFKISWFRGQKEFANCLAILNVIMLMVAYSLAKVTRADKTTLVLKYSFTRTE